MFEYLKGMLVSITPLKAVIDCHGVGYVLLVPVNHLGRVTNESEVCFYTSLVIREDAHRLYGFLSRAERDLFETLIEVSGIGPKTSLALVGHLGVNDFENAILSSNYILISKVPGIGKKTAERLVIEMRDKLKSLYKKTPLSATSLPSESLLMQDAVSALTHLGYHPLEVHKAIKKILQEEEKEYSLSELITVTLKVL